MVKKICLDSDIIIGLLNNNKEIVDKMKSLDADFYTTSIHSLEVWYGRKKNDQIKELLEWLKILPFGDYTSKLGGDILRKLKEEGIVIDLDDLFTASICIQNKVELLTNNKKGFEKLKKFGLKLV